jgi:quinol-cytochrome oxidoreductase complex cytochrome b subunit
MFYYKPEPSLASLSLLDLEATSSFAFLRSVHFWGSRALVMVVWLHLFRVMVRQAYRPPRHRGWLLGIGLLLLTLALARSGAILPSERATHSSAQILLAIYVLHCAALPMAFCGGLGWHLWQTRRKGEEAP